MFNKKTWWNKTIAFIIFFLISYGAIASSDYPNRTIKLLIPYPPGGSADMLARPIAKEMQEILGEPVILDYKPGAGGSIATGILANSEPDGYTLLMVLAAHAINPSLYADLPYDTKSDFQPISLLATLPLLVTAPLETPADSIPELIQYAKDNPGELTFASAGNGNTSHLAVELFKLETDTDMLHIPYRGSGPAVVALLAGEISFMFDSISTSLPHVKEGKLKALGVTSEERSPLIDNVPTVAEQGVEGFSVDGWYGVLAPAGTPDEIVTRLQNAFQEAVQQTSVRELLEKHGYNIVGSTANEFSSHLDDEFERWKTAIDGAGIEIQ